MAKKIVVKKHEDVTRPVTQPPPPQPLKGFFSRYVLILMAVLAIMMMFDANLRTWFGSAVGYLLYPTVGFDGRLPLLTLFFAGLFMTLISTVVRHYFTDWIATAKSQKMIAAFNKERMNALKSQNTNKLKKMEETQREVNQMNFNNMVTQLKSTAMMMFVAIAVFAWIWLFVESLPNKSFSVPWARNLSFVSSLPCCVPLPTWIALYSLISLPLGMVFGRLLKHYSFKKRLAKLERGRKVRRDWDEYSFIDEKELDEPEMERKRK